ncbi:unnamed protein product, partial [Rotaria sp. Silwood1]
MKSNKIIHILTNKDFQDQSFHQEQSI